MYDHLLALSYLQFQPGPNLRLGAGGAAPAIVDVSGLTLTAAPPNCVGLDSTSDHPSVRLRLTNPASVGLTAQRSGPASLTLTEGGTQGPARGFQLTGGKPVALNVVAPGTDAIVTIPPLGVTQLCGVANASPRTTGQ